MLSGTCFLLEVKRENRNGTQVSYLQLVHNDWDPAARTSRTKILYSFGGRIGCAARLTSGAWRLLRCGRSEGEPSDLRSPRREAGGLGCGVPGVAPEPVA